MTSNPQQLADAPIIVSGLPRSGTTWMQAYLDRHPAIHIAGQTPKGGGWPEWQAWYQQLRLWGAWAVDNNRQLDYPAPHYAGSPPDRCREIFREAWRQFVCGFSTDPPPVRWGWKGLGLCWSEDWQQQVQHLWPAARWIIGLRNPRRIVESLRNTYRADAPLTEYLGYWVNTCRFVESLSPDRCATFDIDRLAELSPEQRQTALEPVWHAIGEQPTRAVRRFAADMPVVHKVRPDSQRQTTISPYAWQLVVDRFPDARRYLDWFHSRAAAQSAS